MRHLLLENRLRTTLILWLLFLGIPAVVFAETKAPASRDVPGEGRLSVEKQYGKFTELVREGKYEDAESFLRDWEKSQPGDPDLAVAWANLWIEMAKPRVGMEITRLPEGSYTLTADDLDSSGPSSFSIRDPNTGQRVGEIAPPRARNDELTSRALAKLQETVEAHPERLDIWFGIAHLLQTEERPDEQYSVLVKAVAYAASNPSKLQWMQGRKLPEPPEEFVPASLHGYSRHYISQENAESDRHFLRIAELALKHYPKHPVAYNDIAAYHAFRDENLKAIEWMKKGLELDPKDAIITFNIGVLYQQEGNKREASRWLRKAADLAGNNSDLKQEAEERLRKLK